MRKTEFIDKITFYFENACVRTHKSPDATLVNKVRNILQQLKPQKMWEEKGIENRNLQANVYPDFVMILNGKLIACEVIRFAFVAKFDLYNGIKIFDEIWFFTDIPAEKNWLHYKLQNNLKSRQKFFGLNEKGEITLIKELDF